HDLARVTLTDPLPISTNTRALHDALPISAMFSGIKSKPRIAEEHDSVSSLIAAVETGIGVAVATESLACTAGPRLRIIPFLPAPDRKSTRLTPVTFRSRMPSSA